MKEFIARGQWLQSLLHIHHQQFDEALNLLVQASNLAEQTNSRLSQYVIQIQKSYVYHVTGNSPASRDAMTYAQKIEKRLVDSLADDATRRTFLDSYHARHLQEIVAANTQKIGLA